MGPSAQLVLLTQSCRSQMTGSVLQSIATHPTHVLPSEALDEFACTLRICAAVESVTHEQRWHIAAERRTEPFAEIPDAQCLDNKRPVSGISLGAVSNDLCSILPLERHGRSLP
jgi:hypothetical protein